MDGWLRIGVNLFPLSRGGGGMRQYVLQLLPWLLRLSPHRLVLFHGPQGQPSVAGLLRRLHPSQRNRVRLVAIDDQEAIYRHAQSFDVYFCPLNCLVPDLLDRPTLVALADVQERYFPHYFSAENLRLRAEMYPHAARAATILLTISAFSKKCICDGFGVPPAKVKVTHLSADALADVSSCWPAGVERPRQPYFFYPANLYPHKNHVLLLDSICLLRKRGLDCSCVLTGQLTQPGIDIRAEVRQRGLDEYVCWYRQVSAAALRYLYENAAALACPSQFEGFGLPLVEAMRCGCPVAATATASIPEVVGDAALLASATPEEFADALVRLLTDADLRADLIARGRTRAALFSGKRQAEQTLQAIDEAIRLFYAPCTHQPAATVRYVVGAVHGGLKLVRTLASLSFEVSEDDEILIVANCDSVGSEVEALADNLGIARFIGPSTASWLEGTADFLCYLGAGDLLCEGASRAAVQAFADHPEAVVVAGSALAVDRRYRPIALCYRPGQPDRPGIGAKAPSAALFWRQSWLAQQRAALDNPRWPEQLLALAGERVCPLPRTIAYVAAGQPPLRQLARRSLRRLPAWLRQPLRRLARALSGKELSP